MFVQPKQKPEMLHLAFPAKLTPQLYVMEGGGSGYMKPALPASLCSGGWSPELQEHCPRELQGCPQPDGASLAGLLGFESSFQFSEASGASCLLSARDSAI